MPKTWAKYKRKKNETLKILVNCKIIFLSSRKSYFFLTNKKVSYKIFLPPDVSIHYSSSCTLSINTKYISAWSILCTKNNENKYNKNSRPIDSKNVFSFYHRIYLAVTSRAHTFVFLSAENNASSEPRGLLPLLKRSATFQNDVSTNWTFSLLHRLALCISIAIWEFLRKRNTAASDEVRLSSRKELEIYESCLYVVVSIP